MKIDEFVLVYPCKKKCKSLKAKTNTYNGGNRYCRTCECYFKTTKQFCPCCNTKLRLKAR